MLRKSENGFTVAEIFIVAVIVIVIGFVGWTIFGDDNGDKNNNPNTNSLAKQDQQPEKDKHDINPQVWTKNGYDGASYEYKVNCGPDYKTLNECFLWDLTKVVVSAPNGKKTKLNKDFNINSYSGEITRRWVLYGEAGAGFPKSGEYTFNYYKKDKLVYNQILKYTPNILDAPSNITWKRIKDDLHVSWTPPKGIKEGDTYKVIVFRENEVLSQLEQWGAKEAVLKNFPLKKGEKVEMNVSSYFDGGYAYPKSIDIVWE